MRLKINLKNIPQNPTAEILAESPLYISIQNGQLYIPRRCFPTELQLPQGEAAYLANKQMHDD